MAEYETSALRRAKILRAKLNLYNGIDDDTVTEGVKRLLRNAGNEKLIQNEAAMMLDIYPDPDIVGIESGRLMDYGNPDIVGTESGRLMDYGDFILKEIQKIEAIIIDDWED